MSKGIIGLDAGHSPIDTGNVGPTGYKEWEGTWNIVQCCEAELLRNGFDVVQARQAKDEGPDNVSERAGYFNIKKAGLVVSVHTNAFSDPKVEGAEAIYSVYPGSKGKLLAESILHRLDTTLGIKTRRTFTKTREDGKDYYGIIRDTNMTAIILEVNFHSNPEVEAVLKDPAYLWKVGTTIAWGIMDFLGQTPEVEDEKKPETSETSQPSLLHTQVLDMIVRLMGLNAWFGINTSKAIDELFALLQGK